MDCSPNSKLIDAGNIFSQTLPVIVLGFCGIFDFNEVLLFSPRFRILLANTMSSVPEEDRLEKFSSTKTISLQKVIRENAEAMVKGIRMIVFVDERATAVALAQILNTANNPNIRADSVVGVAPGCNGISAKLVAKVGLRSPA